MRKDISPELYNYNKYPGPQFVSFDNVVKSESYEFSLVKNEKEAFDSIVFTQRFSELLLKYDYIVGDWGNEQLRLKGFYDDEKPVKRYQKISRLEDYLREYCNFGCAYFVLRNDKPEVIEFEEEIIPTKRKKGKKSEKKHQQNQKNFKRYDKNARHKSRKSKKNNDRREKNQKRDDMRQIQNAKQNFVVRKKQR